VAPRHEHATTASTESEAAYERHRPEETVLYATVQAHWRTFLADLEATAESPALPAFVVAEVEACLSLRGRGHGRAKLVRTSSSASGSADATPSITA
jgi:hypothetical protein